MCSAGTLRCKHEIQLYAKVMPGNYDATLPLNQTTLTAQVGLSSLLAPTVNGEMHVAVMYEHLMSDCHFLTISLGSGGLTKRPWIFCTTVFFSPNMALICFVSYGAAISML